jgi:hypothetical protein
MIPPAVERMSTNSRERMPDDDFDDDFDEFEAEEPDLEAEEPDLDEDALEEDLAEDLGDTIDEESEGVVAEEDEEEEEEVPVAKKRRVTEEEDEDEELIDPDDVEADLDTILKDRIAAGDDEEDDDEEEVAEVETGTESGDRVLPRRADEFVCQSCFLVKHVRQRVGADNICRDCV